MKNSDNKTIYTISLMWYNYRYFFSETQTVIDHVPLHKAVAQLLLDIDLRKDSDRFN